MAPFFTVRWPRFARLEACLLYVAVVMICGRSIGARLALREVLAIAANDLGLADAPVFWGLSALIVSVPFLCAMVVVDRLLTVRRGFAFLALLAVAVWALVGAAISGDLPAWTSAILTSGLVSPWRAALYAGGAALLIHARPLWVGLSDRGFVGLRLAARSGSGGDERTFGKAEPGPWLAPNPRGRKAPERGCRRVVLVWLAVLAAGIFGYVAFYHGAPVREISVQGDPAAFPRIAAPPGETATGRRDDGHFALDTPVVNPPPKDEPRPFPRNLSPAAEASAGRRGDGHFIFAAMVNGVPASLLFDTGATMVTIRAEDAPRLGLLVDTLRFSVKVSTANGVGLVAATHIGTLTVGSITQLNVPAFVASPGMLRENVLGQSFLKNLRQVTVENNQVILKSN